MYHARIPVGLAGCIFPLSKLLTHDGMYVQIVSLAYAAISSMKQHPRTIEPICMAPARQIRSFSRANHQASCSVWLDTKKGKLLQNNGQDCAIRVQHPVSGMARLGGHAEAYPRPSPLCGNGPRGISKLGQGRLRLIQGVKIRRTRKIT